MWYRTNHGRLERSAGLITCGGDETIGHCTTGTGLPCYRSPSKQVTLLIIRHFSIDISARHPWPIGSCCCDLEIVFRVQVDKVNAAQEVDGDEGQGCDGHRHLGHVQHQLQHGPVLHRHQAAETSPVSRETISTHVLSVICTPVVILITITALIKLHLAPSWSVTSPSASSELPPSHQQLLMMLIIKTIVANLTAFVWWILETISYLLLP